MQNLHPPLQRVKVFAKCKAIPTKYNISHKTANFESRGPPLYDGVRITEILYQLPYRSLNCLAILWSNLKCHIWSFTEWIRSNDFSFDFEWVVCTFDSWVFKAYWLGRRQKYGNGDSHCGTTYLCTTKKKTTRLSFESKESNYLKKLIIENPIKLCVGVNKTKLLIWNFRSNFYSQNLVLWITIARLKLK